MINWAELTEENTQRNGQNRCQDCEKSDSIIKELLEGMKANREREKRMKDEIEKLKIEKSKLKSQLKRLEERCKESDDFSDEEEAPSLVMGARPCFGQGGILAQKKNSMRRTISLDSAGVGYPGNAVAQNLGCLFLEEGLRQKISPGNISTGLRCSERRPLQEMTFQNNANIMKEEFAPAHPLQPTNSAPSNNISASTSDLYPWSNGVKLLHPGNNMDFSQNTKVGKEIPPYPGLENLKPPPLIQPAQTTLAPSNFSRIPSRPLQNHRRHTMMPGMYKGHSKDSQMPPPRTGLKRKCSSLGGNQGPKKGTQASRGKCCHSGCSKCACFGYQNQNIMMYCSTHAHKGMVNLKSKKCKHPGCSRTALFGDPNDGLHLYCSQHKKEGMKNLKSKSCEFEGCETCPSFAYPGQRARFCMDHRLEGMVVPDFKRCEYDGCPKRRMFGFLGQQAYLCGDHRQPGMVDLMSKRCAEEGCNLRPSFGYETDTSSTYCKKHAKPTMVNNKGRKCERKGCHRSPTYGFLDQEIRFCSTHREVGMINLRIRNTCDKDKCNKAAKYALPGEALSRCKLHKNSDMVLASKSTHSKKKQPTTQRQPAHPTSRTPLKQSSQDEIPSPELSRFVFQDGSPQMSISPSMFSSPNIDLCLHSPMDFNAYDLNPDIDLNDLEEDGSE